MSLSKGNLSYKMFTKVERPLVKRAFLPRVKKLDFYIVQKITLVKVQKLTSRLMVTIVTSAKYFVFNIGNLIVK